MLPPNTVKSCETITAQRPSIRAVPVTAPSAGAGRDRPSSRTSPPISVKLPGSHRYAIRSRAVIAARRRCFSTASGRRASVRSSRASSITLSRSRLSASREMRGTIGVALVISGSFAHASDLRDEVALRGARRRSSPSRNCSAIPRTAAKISRAFRSGSTGRSISPQSRASAIAPEKPSRNASLSTTRRGSSAGVTPSASVYRWSAPRRFGRLHRAIEMLRDARLDRAEAAPPAEALGEPPLEPALHVTDDGFEEVLLAAEALGGKAATVAGRLADPREAGARRALRGDEPRFPP